MKSEIFQDSQIYWLAIVYHMNIIFNKKVLERKDPFIQDTHMIQISAKMKLET